MHPIPSMNFLIRVNDGIDRPFVQITSHITADISIDSKNGELETMKDNIGWKIHCGESSGDWDKFRLNNLPFQRLLQLAYQNGIDIPSNAERVLLVNSIIDFQYRRRIEEHEQQLEYERNQQTR